MKQLEELSKVLQLISWWLTTIKTHNVIGFFDINKIAEGVILKLLNEIYELNLTNLNNDQTNYPSIDLGDDLNKIGVQVTTRRDSRKIYESLEKFARGPIQRYINGIRIVILNEGKKPRLNKNKCREICPQFDPERHIITANDLIKEIRMMYDSNKGRFYRIKKVFEMEFPGKSLGDEEEKSGTENSNDYCKQVFISYSHRDKEFIDKLTIDLKNKGLSVWRDEKEIMIGDSITKKIEEGISKCDFFCLVISSHSIRSRWVEQEYRTALNTSLASKNAQIILPLLIEEVPLPNFLRDIKCADFLRGYHHGLAPLLKRLGVKSDDVSKEEPEILSVMDDKRQGTREAKIAVPERKNKEKKILFLSANHPGEVRLRIDQEYSAIDTALHASKYRDLLKLIPKFAVNYSKFRQGLLNHEPQMVHISCHGEPKGLLMFDESGIFPELMTFEVVAELFKLLVGKIQCVIINACSSQPLASILVKHIPCIIGMQGDIEDNPTIQFSSDFYEAIGSCRSIEDAFQFGCLAVKQAFPDLTQHAIPSLQKKPGTPGQTFILVPPPAGSPESDR